MILRKGEPCSQFLIINLEGTNDWMVIFGFGTLVLKNTVSLQGNREHCPGGHCRDYYPGVLCFSWAAATHLKSNVTGINTQNEFKNYIFEITATSDRGLWITPLIILEYPPCVYEAYTLSAHQGLRPFVLEARIKQILSYTIVYSIIALQLNQSHKSQNPCISVNTTYNDR